jgi:acetyl esterase/lipase
MTQTPATGLGSRHLIAPELLPALDLLPSIDLSDATLAAMRAPLQGERGMTPPPLTPDQRSVACEERFVPGPADAPDVRILVYTPPGDATDRPAILHMHGGGMILGMPEINDGMNRALAIEHGCVIVSVDYRLAPETRWFGSYEDNYAALAWLHAQADALGVDRTRIAVAGESAGGGHAAALALLARDRGDYRVCFQLLDCPMLDDRTGTAAGPPPHPFAGEFVWTPASNNFGWRQLLGQAPGGADVPDAAAPARAPDLAGLPPVFIAIGALDLFLEESLDYVRRLSRAGVPVELHVIPGAFHAYTAAGPDAPQVQAMMRYRRDALARAFAKPDERTAT